MRCPACQTDNRPGVRFCEECGAKLETVCPACGTGVPPGKKFCGACGTALGSAPAPAEASAVRFAAPRAYTPAHLAERILKDRAALSDPRVTVLAEDPSAALRRFAHDLDVVALFGVEPSTAAANRFFTAEFYAEAARALKGAN